MKVSFLFVVTKKNNIAILSHFVVFVKDFVLRFGCDGMMGGGIQPESHNERVYDQCEAFVYPLRKITGYVLIASLSKKAHVIDVKALYKEDKT